MSEKPKQRVSGLARFKSDEIFAELVARGRVRPLYDESPGNGEYAIVTRYLPGQLGPKEISHQQIDGPALLVVRT